MGDLQPVNRIDPVSPAVSLLTSARDRTLDDFGGSSPIPAGAESGLPEGTLVPTSAAWRTGMAWDPVSCQPSYTETRCDASIRHDPAELTGPVGTDAFRIYTPLSCDWTLRALGEVLAADARDLTEAHLAWGLARALWMGDGLPDHVTVNGDTTKRPVTLRRAATDVSIGGVAADLDDAVAALLSNYEQCTGGLGGAVLHIPSVLMVGALGGIPNGGRICWPEGNLYRAALGSVVSPGPGYPHGGHAQDAFAYGPQTGATTEIYKGNATDECWVYVSGPIEYAKSDVQVLPEDENERRNWGRTNTYEVWAQREAIVRFDPCCVYAALVKNTAGQVS